MMTVDSSRYHALMRKEKEKEKVRSLKQEGRGYEKMPGVWGEGVYKAPTIKRRRKPEEIGR